MRSFSPLALAFLLVAGCNARPAETPPAGHGALYPPEYSREVAEEEGLRSVRQVLR